MSDDHANQALLRRAWKARNGIYEELFGEHAFVLPKRYEVPPSPLADAEPIKDPKSAVAAIKSMLGTVAHKPVSVLAYAPNETRSYWMYVTSGLSNPWFQDSQEEVSGFGCELLIKSSKNSRWAVRALRRMAYYIMSYAGTLSPGVILKVDAPLGGLHNIFVWYPDEATEDWFQLPSGGFGVFCAIGITDDECEYAESVTEYGVWCIQHVLRQIGIGQITDPARPSIMCRDNITELLESARNYADNFRSMQSL
jgi:hypothetical protein